MKRERFPIRKGLLPLISHAVTQHYACFEQAPLRRPIGRGVTVSPAGQARTWGLANLKVSPSLWSLLGLVVGLLTLAQQATLLDWNFSDQMPHHAVPPTEKLIPDDSSPDGNLSAVTGLTVGDCDLPPTTVIGAIALTDACLWPIRYLERPRLLT